MIEGVRNVKGAVDVRRSSLISSLIVAATAAFTLALAPPGAAHRNSSPSVYATPENDGQHPWSTDGCSTGIPGVTANGIPKLYNFRHACVHHDGCYNGYSRHGVTPYWYTRNVCDTHFLGDMTKSCSSAPTLVRVACRGIAGTYYTAVRFFARKAYKGPASMAS